MCSELKYFIGILCYYPFNFYDKKINGVAKLSCRNNEEFQRPVDQVIVITIHHCFVYVFRLVIWLDGVNKIIIHKVTR